MPENDNPSSAVLSNDFSAKVKEAFQPLADAAKADKQAKAAPAAPATAPAAPVIPPLAPITPAAVAPVATPDDEADLAIESGKVSPKSADFKRVKESAKKYRSEAETLAQEKVRLEGELKAAKSAPVVDTGEVERIKQEKAQLAERLAVLETGWSPEFQEKYNKRALEVKGSLAAVSPEKADQLFGIISLPNSKQKTELLAQVLEDADEFTKQEVYAANRDLAKVEAERTAELKNASTIRDGIIQNRQAQAKAHQESLDKAFDVTAAELMKDNPLFQPREGDETWNASVRERIATAKALYGGNQDPQARAKAAAHAASYPLLVGALQQAQARTKELEAQLKSVSASAPGLNGGVGGKQASGNEKSFTERFIEGIQKK